MIGVKFSGHKYSEYRADDISFIPFERLNHHLLHLFPIQTGYHPQDCANSNM